MNKSVHPWFRGALVLLLVTILSTQPPKTSYSRDGQNVKSVKVDSVTTIFQDKEVSNLVDSASIQKDIIADNDKSLRDGTAIIKRQALLIKEQNDLIDSLETANK